MLENNLNLKFENVDTADLYGDQNISGLCPFKMIWLWFGLSMIRKYL